MRSSHFLLTYAAAAALALATAAPAHALSVGGIGNVAAPVGGALGLGAVPGVGLGTVSPSSLPSVATGHAKAPNVALPAAGSKALASSMAHPAPRLPVGVKGHSLPGLPGPASAAADKADAVAVGKDSGLPAAQGANASAVFGKSSSPSPHVAIPAKLASKVP